MKTKYRLARYSAVWGTLALIVAFVLAPVEGQARGGRGGGGGGGGRSYGGGGGARSYGGGASYGGGGARSYGGASPSYNHSYNRSPSMSRPSVGYSGSPSVNRGVGGGAVGSRPAVGAGGVGTAGGAGAYRSGSPGRESFQRPSQDQLSGFLNLPQSGGTRASAFSGQPSQLPNNSGVQSKSITTPGGSTITIAGGAGSGTTGGGATLGGAGAGIKIEGSGGNTYVGGKGVVGGTNNGNSAIAGGSVRGVSDGQNSAIAARGGAAGRTSSGYTAVRAGAGVATSAGNARVGSVGAVRGPGGNTIAAGRGASFSNGQFVGGQSFRAVNGNFTQWNCYSPGWIGRYPGAWWPGKWAVATSAWATAAWATAGSYCGCADSGTYYDYGENVTYDDGTVYYGDQAVATSEQYYEEANQLANNTTANTETAPNEDWMPLGVFALVEANSVNVNKLFQLAINRDGMIRGNFHDTINNSLVPIQGSVNKQTQRVAFKLEGNDSLVIETGLYNLTNDEVPILLHGGAERQESRVLARLKQPQDSGEQPPTVQPNP